MNKALSSNPSLDDLLGFFITVGDSIESPSCTSNEDLSCNLKDTDCTKAFSHVLLQVLVVSDIVVGYKDNPKSSKALILLSYGSLVNTHNSFICTIRARTSTQNTRCLVNLPNCQPGPDHPKRTPQEAHSVSSNQHVRNCIQRSDNEPTAHKCRQPSNILIRRSSLQRGSPSHETCQDRSDKQRRLLHVVRVGALGALKSLEHGIWNLAFDGGGRERGFRVSVVGFIAT